ncbi:MAG: superinfection immunity protein [Solirubrobacteraceae bacterium]
MLKLAPSGPILAPTDPAAVIVGLVVAAYLLPSLIALARHHEHRRRLIAGNLLLGWTLVGWTICMGLALRSRARPRADRERLGVP